MGIEAEGADEELGMGGAVGANADRQHGRRVPREKEPTGVMFAWGGLG